MEQVMKNLANLLKVKTLVTLMVVTVFSVLALSGKVSTEQVMVILSMVISFYFGTQHEKKDA